MILRFELEEAGQSALELEPVVLRFGPEEAGLSALELQGQPEVRLDSAEAGNRGFGNLELGSLEAGILEADILEAGILEAGIFEAGILEAGNPDSLEGGKAEEHLHFLRNLLVGSGLVLPADRRKASYQYRKVEGSNPRAVAR